MCRLASTWRCALLFSFFILTFSIAYPLSLSLSLYASSGNIEPRVGNVPAHTNVISTPVWLWLPTFFRPLYPAQPTLSALSLSLSGKCPLLLPRHFLLHLYFPSPFPFFFPFCCVGRLTRWELCLAPGSTAPQKVLISLAPTNKGWKRERERENRRVPRVH